MCTDKDRRTSGHGGDALQNACSGKRLRRGFQGSCHGLKGQESDGSPAQKEPGHQQCIHLLMQQDTGTGHCGQSGTCRVLQNKSDRVD